jgi:hypothetical protein
MADLFAWLVKEDDGREGPVCALIPGLNMAAPLVSLSLALAELLEGVARAHADATGKPVRLVRYTEAETLRRL